MSYSDSFPAQRPSFMFDASNSGRIPPNMTYTRASTANVFDGSKHLSSQNLVLNSEALSGWDRASLTPTANAGTAPDGSTTADSFIVNTTGIYPWIWDDTAGATDHTGDIVFSVYAKANGWRWIQLFFNDANQTVWFDLQNGVVGTEAAGSTGTMTAVGSTGWYRCSIHRSGTNRIKGAVAMVDGDNTKTGTAHPTNAALFWGAQLTTGYSTPTAYNATTTQIHREYASSLVSKANDIGRFEVGVDGQSEGILIESQAQNLIAYSSDSTQWSKAYSSLTGSAAVAPDGSLSASAWVPDTSLNSHYTHPSSLPTVASGTTYTGSVYVKSAGLTLCQLTWSSAGFGAGYKVNFNLAGSGSVVATAGGASGTISQCGDGWFRLSITAAATSSGSGVMVIGGIDSESSGRLPSYSGDGYNGLLIWQLQQETGSFPSSAISTSGAAATRAADSLSVATADIPGFSEGVGTIVCETGGVASATETNQLAFGLNGPASSNLFSAGVNNGGVTDSTVRVYSQTPDGDQAFLNPGTATVGTGYKLACRYELDNIAASMNGGTVVSDTSGKVPVGIDTLWVGELEGNYHINSNIKRIAIYGEALSDTNLISLTS